MFYFLVEGVTPASALIVWTVLEPLVSIEEDREVYSRLHLTLLQSLQGKHCTVVDTGTKVGTLPYLPPRVADPDQ